MFRLLPILSLLCFVLSCHLASSAESTSEENISQLVFQDIIPILKAFRRRAMDYQRQLNLACPNDDPELVDCECTTFRLPPDYSPESIGPDLAWLRTGDNGRLDAMSMIMECQPEYCTCLDGTMVTMNKTEFCEGEELKDIHPDFIADRMSKWAAEIVQCKRDVLLG